MIVFYLLGNHLEYRCLTAQSNFQKHFVQFSKDLPLDPDTKGVLVLSIYPCRNPCRQQGPCMQTVKRQWRGKARGMSEEWAAIQMVPVCDIHGCEMSTDLLTWALLSLINSLHQSSIIGASCRMLLS